MMVFTSLMSQIFFFFYRDTCFFVLISYKEYVLVFLNSMNRSVFLMNKKSYSHNKMGNLKSSKKRKVLKVCLIIFISLFVVGIVTVAVWMKINVFEGLPDVTQVKDMQFQQATIITDRNGVELYKLFEENREYVTFDQMNTNR